MFDFVALSTTREDRVIEFVDHLHEHFVTPVEVREGRYWPPTAPGSGAEMLESSRTEYEFTQERARRPRS
jgi:L-fuconate dehydratase